MPEWSPQIRRLADSERHQLLYANSLFRERRVDEARAEVEKILLANDRSLPATVAVGITYIVQRRAKDALTFFERAIDLDPMAPGPLVLAGFAHLSLGDLDRAEQSFYGALDLDSHLPMAHIGLARTMQRRGDLEAATTHAERTVELAPNLQLARVMVATLHGKTGQMDAATDAIDALLSMHPGQRGVASLLSMTFSQPRRNQEPVRLLESATQFDPDSAASWVWLGRAKMQAGEPAEAEAAFRRAYEIDRWSVVAALGLADSLIKQAVLDEAREVLGAIPRRLGAKPWIHKLEGDAYAAEGLMPEAAESYTAALLNSRGGSELAMAIEQECLQNEDVDWPDVIARYQAAVERLFPVHQKKLHEQDWQTLARRFNRSAWDAGQESDPDEQDAGSDGKRRRISLQPADETDK